MPRQDNTLVLHAFPTSLRDEAELAISVLPTNPYGVGNFTVRVNGEAVLIPNRVYYDPGSIKTHKLSIRQRIWLTVS
jgi:hypothetical protein